VSTPLGYVMPDRGYRAWTLDTRSPAAALRERTRELVEAVREHGLPFMRSAADPGALVRLLDQGTGVAHQLVFRRPVAWLLEGDPARARAELDRTVAELGNRKDPAAEQVRRFAAALRPRLAA
jgi:hypothetical protein